MADVYLFLTVLAALVVYVFPHIYTLKHSNSERDVPKPIGEILDACR